MMTAATHARSVMREHVLVTPPLDEQRARRLSNAARKAQEWRQQRDAQIVQAFQAGAGLREIGRITRLSHPAIKKILEKNGLYERSDEIDHLPPGEHVDEGNLTVMSIEEHEKFRPRDDEDSDDQD